MNLILLLSILSWYSYTRIVRSEVLTVKSSVYVEAARACGASDVRIVFRHILPQVFPVLIVVTIFDFSTVMLAEAGISFLGMGIQPPDTSWGRMISEGQQFITTGSWWLFAAPGLAIFLTVLSLRLGSLWISRFANVNTSAG
jgi:peptide/nickel transport system permease protein